jgi:TPR repeat protein
MRRLPALALALAVPLMATGAEPRANDEPLEQAGARAIEASDFGTAIDLLMSRANAGDAEAQFTIGYVAYLWLEAPAPKAPPRYSLDQIRHWMEQAARQGLPQAAGFLREGYQWGRFGLAKDAALEACWRNVELTQRPRDAQACFAAAPSRPAP